MKKIATMKKIDFRFHKKKKNVTRKMNVVIS